MIPCQELNAKRQIRVKNPYESNLYQNKVLNHISTKLPKVLLHLWAESWIHLSHKRTLWIEEPEWKFRKKGMQEDSYTKDKSTKKHKKCKMAWERGTHEYFYLPYVTILWCPIYKLPEDRDNKWNSFSWPQKSYLDLEILLSILPNWTIINDLKYIYLPFEKSRYLEEFNMFVCH